MTYSVLGSAGHKGILARRTRERNKEREERQKVREREGRRKVRL